MIFFERQAGKGFELILKGLREKLPWVRGKFV
jgi:hypothetical protein